MNKAQKISDLREKSDEEQAKGNFETSIALRQELIGLLGDTYLDLKQAALQWEDVAHMLIKLNRPVEAEAAGRNALEKYLRNRAMLEQGRWNPEEDTYLADFRMVLAISLAYQKRYAEAFPLAEQWERVHLKLKEPDDPFIQNVVVPHMKRMRARVAGLPYP